MEHSEFVDKYNSGLLAVHVDRSAAGFLYKKPGLIPKRHRIKQAIIRSVLYGGVGVGLVLFIFVPWYVALLVLFLAFSISAYATRTAAKAVLLTALADPDFYEMVRQRGILRPDENT